MVTLGKNDERRASISHILWRLTFEYLIRVLGPAHVPGSFFLVFE